MNYFLTFIRDAKTTMKYHNYIINSNETSIKCQLQYNTNETTIKYQNYISTNKP